MAMMAYAYLKGQKSGQIKGSITQKGREDSIGVIAVSHEIVSPRDPQSGLPTGQRMHKPFVITKELDKSSPILFNVLCTNENISEAVFKFWTPQVKAATGVGGEVQHYTIKLTNANIATISFRMANIRHADLVKLTEFEEIAMTYQKIEWTWNDGGITADDDWESRK
ncbi:MAG: type VI secretion system tube protein Hcp [Planctomycetes bacterium]|nr:type VI secretion system tube protein Hcp [Planctomycetota bacterium]